MPCVEFWLSLFSTLWFLATWILRVSGLEKAIESALRYYSAEYPSASADAGTHFTRFITSWQSTCSLFETQWGFSRQNFPRGKLDWNHYFYIFVVRLNYLMCRLQSIRPSLDQMLAALSSQAQQQTAFASAVSGTDVEDGIARQFETASILLQGQTTFLTSLRQPLVLVLQVRAAIHFLVSWFSEEEVLFMCSIFILLF